MPGQERVFFNAAFVAATEVLASAWGTPEAVPRDRIICLTKITNDRAAIGRDRGVSSLSTFAITS